MIPATTRRSTRLSATLVLRHDDLLPAGGAKAGGSRSRRYSRRRLVAAGVPSAAVEVVGIPAFDRTPTARRAGPTRRWLFVLQGREGEDAGAEALLAVAAELEHALVVKPHPLLPFPRWLAERSPAPHLEIAASEVDANTLLGSVDCVIGETSQVLYCAAIAGWSVVFLHFGCEPPCIAVPAGREDEFMARDANEPRRLLTAVANGTAPLLPREAIAPHFPNATSVAVAAIERHARSVQGRQ